MLAVVDIADLAEALTEALGTFEPAVYSAADCARLAETLASTGKACTAASAMAACRAAASGAHRELGFADPSSWVASRAGTTTRQARDALETAKRLEGLPATKEALLAGGISLAEAHEIVRSEQDSPGHEQALLGVARGGDLTQLRDEVRERTLTATPAEALHETQLKARRFRSWRDGLGMVRLDGALPPETGIPLVNRVERLTSRLLRQRKREGSPEPFERVAADALVELAAPRGSGGSGGSGEGGEGGEGAGSTDRRPGGRPPTELVIVCDLGAWRRGHAHEGEPCHLLGGGPIPVDLAKALSEDAFLKVVLHDGKTIHLVSHHGRRYTAELRTALDLGPVPAFSGRRCQDCGRRYGLEYDHVDPVAHTGPTSYDNIEARCYPCHAEKTERDRRAGLLGSRARGRAPGSPGKPRRPPTPPRPPKRRAPPATSRPPPAEPAA